MATALSNHSSSNDPRMEQAKQVFLNLSGQQQQEFLRQVHMGSNNAFNTTGVQQPSLAHQTPRSMQFDLTTANLGPMDRTRSAPVASAMGRSMSTTNNVANPEAIQRSLSVAPAWQTSNEDQANAYTLYSESAAFSKQPTLQYIPESTSNGSMVEYSPDEYITSCIVPSSSPQIPLSHPQHPQLQLQLTPNSQWTSSSDGSASPSTPALMTPATQASSMSRQSSFNPQLFNEDLSMLRVHSDSSSAMLSLLHEDGSISFPVFDDSKTISSCVDSSFLTFTGLPSENFLSTANVVSATSAQALVSSETEPYLGEDTRRSASSFDESNASGTSVPSVCSRQSQRQREINAQASRKLAPKAHDALDEAKSMSSSAQMTRIRSEDGSSKTVGVLTKTPYVRPQHPKIMCQYCSERPEGFRGTHELDRHVARAHAAVRKGFICIDASTDKKFLANCKHCRNKKVYGAYYNAAAHLRRTHFYPRKRGRKGKNDEKRGGIGGGDHPPMDYLRQNWIKEVEVENKPMPASPESVSDSAEPSQDSFDSSYDMDVSYSSPSQLQPQPTTDLPVQIDANQYMDFGISMNASEPIVYDQTFATYDNINQPINDINSFQFDAYANQ